MVIVFILIGMFVISALQYKLIYKSIALGHFSNKIKDGLRRSNRSSDLLRRSTCSKLAFDKVL